MRAPSATQASWAGGSLACAVRRQAPLAAEPASQPTLRFGQLLRRPGAGTEQSAPAPAPLLLPGSSGKAAAARVACPPAEKSVHCEMDREANLGQVKCTLCQAHYAVKINALSEPVDVFQLRVLSSFFL